VRPLSLRSPEEALVWVLHNAGARPRDRDAVDLRIIETVRQGTGALIDTAAQLEDMLSLELTSRALTLPDAPGEIAENGYTHLENWLRTFAASVE
ncbi:MAG: hypothetical protein KAH38_11640, partial [Candidatus Hydrogenedentes bacterium]|nr:hypothetical protein [Candidatus Hydrogenedentota bacterium]